MDILRKSAITVALASAAIAAGGTGAAQAGTLRFCDSVLSPDQYCNSSTTSGNIWELDGYGTAHGAFGLKAFFTDGTSTAYKYGYDSTGYCISPHKPGYGRIKNTGSAAHTYTGWVNTYPDTAGC